MDVLQHRYKKAKHNSTRAAFKSFRLQLSTLEGVREMFYLYTCDRVAERSHIQEEMRREL